MLSEEKRFVLELFGLTDYDVENISYSNVSGDAFVDITLKNNVISCPDCGYDHPRIQGYVAKKITHSILSDRRCILNYHARRYKCPICHRTYYEHNPFVFKSQKISTLTVKNILTDLKDYNETFSSVARRAHVSATTVATIFDNHVSIPRRTLPSMINFDEVYAFKSNGSSYVCVLIDYKTRKPIDILPSRRLDYLTSHFMSIPIEERKNVKVCCFDMYDGYRSVMNSCFPNSVGVLDYFHLMQEYSRRADRTRIRIMKGQEKGTDEYYLLKKFNWMFYKSPLEKTRNGKLNLFDENVERKYNYHFRSYLNYNDIRLKLLAIHPDLKKIMDLRDDIVYFYTSATSENAEEQLNKLIQTFKECNLPEMLGFNKTMYKWRNEIINSIRITSWLYKVNRVNGSLEIYTSRMNNGVIENRNAIIKCIKKNANGYTNWPRFRNRVMYVLDKDATFSLNPIVDKSKLKS